MEYFIHIYNVNHYKIYIFKKKFKKITNIHEYIKPPNPSPNIPPEKALIDLGFRGFGHCVPLSSGFFLDNVILFQVCYGALLLLLGGDLRFCFLGV